MKESDHDSATKTNLQNYHAAVLRLTYVVVFLLATMIGAMMIDQLFGGTAYASLAGLVYIATYLLLAPVLALLILGKRVSRLLDLVARSLVGLLGVALLLTVVGSILDLAGVVCSQASCGDTLLHLIGTILVSPAVFLVLMTVMIFGLTKGWRDYLKQRHSP